MAGEGSPEDRLAIRELIEAYGDAVCQHDADAWAALWCYDGIWEFPDIPSLGTIVGKQQIMPKWIEAMESLRGMVMLVTIGRITVDGERATARSYISEAYPRGDQVGRDRGVFEDELVFRDGRWLFKKRTFRYLSRA